MKNRFPERTIILLALLTVFLSGYGVGHLVASKSSTPNGMILSPPVGGERALLLWEEQTVERLDSLLMLNPNQREQVADEIRITTGKLQEMRQLEFQKQASKLYQRLPAHLNQEQRRKVEQLFKNSKPELP